MPRFLHPLRRVVLDKACPSETPAQTLEQSLPNNRRPQQTLARSARFTGVGFVTGADGTLTFQPAPPNRGIYFVRTDLPGEIEIPAHVRHVSHDQRRTGLARDQAVVEMTEHVLAALTGLGIDNCRVELNAAETPAADGSSQPIVEMLLQAGVTSQDRPIEPFVINQVLRVSDGDASIEIHPDEAGGFEVAYHLDVANPGIGTQSASFPITPDTFVKDIAPARTFVLEREIDGLRRMGIGTRHTARDLLVFRDDGTIIDNEQRFANECARHKLLDIVGDLTLAGRPIVGRVVAHRTGHRHNVELARRIVHAFE